MKRAIFRTILVAIGLAILSANALSQKITTKALKMLGDGSLIWNSGETVSRDNIAVGYELQLDAAGNALGYKLDNSGLGLLKSGDRIALYITRIRYSGSATRYYDASGERVWASGGNPPGGWRVVTIDSVKQAPNRVSVLIKESIALDNGKSVNELNYRLENGFLTDITGDEISTSPAPKPEVKTVPKTGANTPPKKSP